MMRLCHADEIDFIRKSAVFHLFFKTTRRRLSRLPAAETSGNQAMGRMGSCAARVAGALGVGALVAGAAPAAAQSFDQLNVFGDSSVDSGAYKVRPSPGGSATYNSLWPAGVAAGAGAPTTNPGLMNSQVLAAYFGLTANPFNGPGGGTNYATSGAKDITVNSSQTGGFTAATPTVTQISKFIAYSGGAVNPNALYLISSGGNDISYAIGATGTGPFPSNPQAYVANQATGLAEAITALHAAGARYILVPDLNYSFPTANTTAAANQRALSLVYSQTLWSGLAAAGVNFIPADFNAVRLAILANPAMFGFVNVDTAPGHMACSQPAGVTTAWALLCSSNPGAPSHLVAPGADQFDLFADDQHYTTAGQKIEADYYYSLIVAPSLISMLAESAVKTRAALVDTIYNHVTRDGAPGPNGFKAWISGDLQHLSFTNYASYPGDPDTPVSGTVGLDVGGQDGADSWLVGGALSVGRDSATFAQNFGGFDQRELVLSAYGLYRTGPFWGTAIASAGSLRDNINRTVPIGITIQQNAASTTGTNYSAAAFGGYEVTWDRLTHGPLFGATAQSVHVAGFTETGSFTSLSFGDQNRDSAVTALGYQVSADLGLFRPFAQLAWNHEMLQTADRQVSASLTTIVAPSYAMPAIAVGKDWATGLGGTMIALGERCTALLAMRGQVGQSTASAFGGQVALSVAF